MDCMLMSSSALRAVVGCFAADAGARLVFTDSASGAAWEEAAGADDPFGEPSGDAGEDAVGDSIGDVAGAAMAS
jgi:hypothetical protein